MGYYCKEVEKRNVKLLMWRGVNVRNGLDVKTNDYNY